MPEASAATAEIGHRTRLIVVAGFLGSGKTTLVLELARRLVADSNRVAVIENEIGDIGIDADTVAGQGLRVKELFGGCVCCTLQVGMVEALKELARTYDPDYVIVEPTGIAQPSELVATVRQYARWLEAVHVVTLIDAERYEMLSEVVGPMLEGQIGGADVVALTKVDALDRARVETLLAALRKSSAEAPVLPVSAPRGVNLDELLERVR